MPDRATIKFQTSLRPESAGVRIRSIEPTGIYVSCADRDTATAFFEYAAMELAVERELIDRHPGQGIAGKLDWPGIIHGDGQGEIIVVLETQATIDETQRTGTQVFMTDRDAAVMDRWKDLDGNYFIIVRDNDELVDNWLVDELRKDLDAPSATG